MKLINDKSLLEINNQLVDVLSEDIDDVEVGEFPSKGLHAEHEEWISEVWHEWAEDDKWEFDSKGYSKETIKEFESAIETINESEYEKKSEDGEYTYATVITFEGDKLILAMAKDFEKAMGEYSLMKARDQKNWWKGLFKQYGRKVFFSDREEEIEREDNPSLMSW